MAKMKSNSGRVVFHDDPSCAFQYIGEDSLLGTMVVKQLYAAHGSTVLIEKGCLYISHQGLGGILDGRLFAGPATITYNLPKMEWVEVSASVQAQVKKECECGVKFTGGIHSSWCPLHA